MKRRRLLWQLYPSYLLIILLSLLLVSWYALHRTEVLYRSQLDRDLTSQAILLGQAVLDRDGNPLPPDQIAALCRKIGAELPIRITVLLADGKVIGDSGEDPLRMENHLNRPEVQAAKAGHPTPWMRLSATLSFRMLYVAVPVVVNGQIAMFVRTAMPLTTIDEARRKIIRRLTASAFFVILLAALTGLYVSRRLTRPLNVMREGAIRFARGDLSYKLPVIGSEEMAALSVSMNQMAAQLDDRMKQIFYEQNTREAVFDSMAEGLLAVDQSRQVIHVNRAGLALLGIDGKAVLGKPVEALIRNAELQRLLKEAMSHDQPVEGDVTVPGNPDLLLKVRGTALRNQNGRRIGALVVMQDITRMRQLEQVRQDFVANVSHELRTPITSIKGFVETLLDGADEDPASRARFLGIIAKQAEHLNAIVSDLLLLSSMEHQTKQNQITLEPQPLLPVLEAAAALCNVQAGQKQIDVEISCDPALTASISLHLFEQAVVNLVDNAIKYSPSGSHVQISAMSQAGELVVEVRDTGSGIGPRHLERLFERFYRVDRGRSRQMGGTGLGLAIVKHIALAHGGRVSAESALGQGSVFRLHLPLAD